MEIETSLTNRPKLSRYLLVEPSAHQGRAATATVKRAQWLTPLLRDRSPVLLTPRAPHVVVYVRDDQGDAGPTGTLPPVTLTVHHNDAAVVGGGQPRLLRGDLIVVRQDSAGVSGLTDNDVRVVQQLLQLN